MTLKSGNHAEATQHGESKGWTCAACGSESMDYQLFEELGDIEGCIEKYGPAPLSAKIPEEKLIRDARAKIYEMGQAAQQAAGEIKKLGHVLNSVDTHAGAGSTISYEKYLGTAYRLWTEETK